MSSLAFSLWTVNLGQKLTNLDHWLANVQTQMLAAKQAGSQALIMPEYVSEQWQTFADSPSLGPQAELDFMAEQGQKAAPALQNLARRHDMYMLAGTWPVASSGSNTGRYTNRAHLFFPDDRPLFTQDKLALTPHENEAVGWNLLPGAKIQSFEFCGVKAAMLICLDIEMPALSALIASQIKDLDLLLVPSMTEMLSGYSRVFGCAKARAVELQTIVAVVGSIGVSPLEPPRPNVAAAAIYVPCEEPLGYSGIFAEIPPACGLADDGRIDWVNGNAARSSGHEKAEANASGTPKHLLRQAAMYDEMAHMEISELGVLLHARDIPVASLRNVRQNGAEVWPGAFDARHVVCLDDG